MRTRGTVTITPDPGTPILFELDREDVAIDIGPDRPPIVAHHHAELVVRWVVDGRAQSVRAVLAGPLELDGIPT